MFRAKDLDGRAVIDLETAKKIGYVDELYLDPARGRVAAFRVSEGSSLTGGRKTIVPASAVETIGPEAIMVRPNADTPPEDGPLDSFPRLSKITGRKVVSEGGRLLGSIDDILIEGADGRVHGYTLKDSSWTAGFSDLFSADHDHHDDYIRGDIDLRLSEDLLIVPEDAVVHGDSRHAESGDHEISAIDRLSSRPAPTSRTTSRASGLPAPPLSETRATGTGAPAYTAARTTEHWDDVRPRFRARWEQRTGARGIWEEHEPAYRYGWEMASAPEYRGRSWSTAEPDLRRTWETRHHDRPWDRVMDAIRDAWEGATDRDATDVAGYRSSTSYDPSLNDTERWTADDAPTTPPGSRRSLL